jgi:hypothetical protein
LIGQGLHPEGRYSPYLGISNPEKPQFAPSGSPTIFADKILTSVIIPDGNHGVIAHITGSGIAVHTARVIIEVLINVHTDNYGTVIRYGNLHAVDVLGYRFPALDCIVGTGVTATSGRAGL